MLKVIQTNNETREDQNIKVSKHILTMNLAEVNQLLLIANQHKSDLSFKSLKIGAVVMFGRPKGRKRIGTIEKLNISKAVIKDNVDFQKWVVPFSMLEVQNN